MNVILSLVFVIGYEILSANAQSRDYWNDLAYNNLQKALNLQNLNQNVAKNVIFFLGDGMTVTTLTAARILKGQQAGNTGEETVLSWETFSSVGLSKTYNTNKQTPDSAGTATALFCGVKTKAKVIAVDDQVEYGNCSSIANASVDSVMTQSQRAGKSVGFISTTRVTHATPACLYAHSPDRGWENNVPLDERQAGCIDIAAQLVEGDNKEIRVIMGGGRQKLTDTNTADPEYPGKTGQRTDGRNIINEWMEGKDTERAKYVWNLEDFNAVDPEDTDYLMGLFERDHMQYENYRKDDAAGEPSIAEMTEKAIKILQKDEDGFFLMVEGGRIDMAHHKGKASDALQDTLAMEAAVAKAMELTNEEDTLIIVTSDHSHTMMFSGYPSRGNPILGLVNNVKGSDGLPYTTLSYANGPGGRTVADSFHETGKRPSLTGTDTERAGYVQDALVPLQEETHGGDDVAIFANGPMAHLIYGTHEQNYIAHVVQYAACIGAYAEECDSDDRGAATIVPSMSAATILPSMSYTEDSDNDNMSAATSVPSMSAATILPSITNAKRCNNDYSDAATLVSNMTFWTLLILAFITTTLFNSQ
ncbi:alkaline phosphatase-like isoform X1 [Amphiura filiformis]|uniref:alkaline phosphatase-like isoform X1 n=1 Tax=Amphiura filiformis TaxID=82378 RepID=UPI003B20E4CA